MKTRLLSLFLGSLSLLLAPAISLAASENAPRQPLDARNEMYGPPPSWGSSGLNLTLDTSTALTYMLFVFLGVITLAVLFKNARRSHLD